MVPGRTKARSPRFHGDRMVSSPVRKSPQLWRMMALSPLSLQRGRQARKAPRCRFEIASAAVFPELLKFAVGSARRCGRVIMTACITFTSTTKVDDLVKVSCCGSGVRSRLVSGIGKSPPSMMRRRSDGEDGACWVVVVLEGNPTIYMPAPAEATRGGHHRRRRRPETRPDGRRRFRAIRCGSQLPQ